jgi:hypothetical protein
VGAIALVAIGAVVFLEHHDSVELRQEIALLRTELQRAAQVAPSSTSAPSSGSPHDRSYLAADTLDQSELRKLREDIGVLRKNTQELTQFTQAAQAAAALKSLGGTETTVPVNLTPAESLKNAGKGTPEAATETLLWAAFGGDVETLSSALVFTPTAREKADAWFAGLPEKMRNQYGSPEKVVALMIAKDAAGLTGMQVLGQKEIAPDNVGVRVRFGSTDGKVKDDNLLMRRVDDGWRMVLPDAAVEKFARQLSGKK